MRRKYLIGGNRPSASWGLDCRGDLVEADACSVCPFCVWLVSLSTMASGFSHVVACVRTPSFFRAE